ncbi:MAG: hypothetical protein ACYS1A_13615 [Planctomycetota bacterium]|jgi:hypothetical protein
MRIKRIIIAVLIGAAIGTVLEYINAFLTFLMPPFIILLPLMTIIGGFIGVVTETGKYIRAVKGLNFEHLPVCAAEFIKLVIKKMRYRKKVRADVAAELIAHFQDELKECTTDDQRQQKAQQLIGRFGDVKLLGVLLRRAKKRCRPLWRTIVARGFQTAGVLILCLIVYVAWFLTGKPVITTNYVEQLNRMVRPTADESLNAAPLYEKAIELYEVSSWGISELFGKKYNEATSEEKQIMEKWLADNKDILDLVIAGSKKPYYWQKYGNKQDTGEMIDVLMPNLAEFRRLAKLLLRWRAWISAEQGRYEYALDDIKAGYRLGQHLLKGNKTFIEQLVGIAIRAMAVQELRGIISQHKIDSAILASLQRDFEQMFTDEDFVISFDAEKLFMYDELQRCFTESRFGGGHLYPPRLMAIGGESWQEEPEYSIPLIIYGVILSPQEWPNFAKVLFTHPNKQETREMAERSYDFYDEIARKNPGQIHSEAIDVEKEAAKIVRGNILLEIMTPAIHRIHEISYRNKTDVEATLTIIAILRCKQDTGDYPENLEELVTASYLRKKPIDSFSDKPFVYKKTDDNFLLYSFGENLKDDGGRVVRNDKGKIKQYANEGDWLFWPMEK